MEEKGKKTKKYEVPEAVDLEGQELTEDELESVAGGMVEPDNPCASGGCCGGGSNSS